RAHGGVGGPRGLRTRPRPAAAAPGATLRCAPAAGADGDARPPPELRGEKVPRHYTRLSRWNYAIDIGLYPLGSCTMKYNPKVNEQAARIPGFAALHPYQPESTLQGALSLMHALERALCEITGLSRATLQPAAGAHG